MAFKRLLILIIVAIGFGPTASLAQTAPNPQPELKTIQPVVEQPTGVEALPLVKWDAIDVTVVEGQLTHQSKPPVELKLIFSSTPAMLQMELISMTILRAKSPCLKPINHAITR